MPTAFAVAPDAPPEPESGVPGSAEVEPDSEVAEEITVEGAAVRRAREQVIGSLESLGYGWRVVRRGDHTVWRAQDHWKGKVLLGDDGTLRVRRTAPRLRSEVPAPLCLIQPTACVKWGAWTVSDRRWAGLEREVVEATNPGLVAWGDAVADQALAERLAALPGRLEACWSDGAPLEGELPLPDAAARRAALLAFWDSRTENAWGAQMRALVEGFVRGVVEVGPDPYTAEERAAFEQTRRSAAPFPFEAPASEVPEP